MAVMALLHPSQEQPRITVVAVAVAYMAMASQLAHWVDRVVLAVPVMARLSPQRASPTLSLLKRVKPTRVVVVVAQADLRAPSTVRVAQVVLV
jgi:hypothetical protein